MNSGTVSAASSATAAQYNNLRKDLVLAGGDFATSGGSANAQTLTLDSQIVTSYTTGMAIKFKAGFTNTAACTININSIGANTIKRIDGTDLQPSDIVSGGTHIIVYDGTNFKLTNTAMNPLLSGTSGEALSVGQAVYMKASDGRLWRTDGDADESTYSFVGVVQTAASGAAETVWYAPPGRIAVGLTSRTIGRSQFISATAGQIDETPHATRFARIGMAISTTAMMVVFPKFIRKGTVSITSATTFATTIGFYAATIMLRAGATGGGTGISIGDDSNTCVRAKLRSANNDGDAVAFGWSCIDANIGTTTNQGSVSAVDQTSFTLNCTTYNATVQVQYIAEN